MVEYRHAFFASEFDDLNVVSRVMVGGLVVSHDIAFPATVRRMYWCYSAQSERV
jgi:hypothetical protein